MCKERNEQQYDFSMQGLFFLHSASNKANIKWHVQKNKKWHFILTGEKRERGDIYEREKSGGGGGVKFPETKKTSNIFLIFYLIFSWKKKIIFVKLHKCFRLKSKIFKTVKVTKYFFLNFRQKSYGWLILTIKLWCMTLVKM